jgi:hypothetical protein
MNSSLPIWAETAGASAIIIIAVFTGIYNYFKTQKPESLHPENFLSDGTNRMLRDMLLALREFQDESSRDIKRTQRFIHELQESINRNTEVIRETNYILKEYK